MLCLAHIKQAWTHTCTAQVVQFYAQNEQNFNAVERILYYTALPSEGDYTKPDDPPVSWPEKGGVQFKEVDLAYREGLPLVLKGVSFAVRPGEKVWHLRRSYVGVIHAHIPRAGRHRWAHRCWEEFTHAGALPVRASSCIVSQSLTCIQVL